jgi:RNA polymerase sigma factor (sigma-70 family)
MIDATEYLENNKGLIESLASKFYLPTSKFSRDDLVQEASLAAVRAINKFDPTKNKSKLSTYVYSAVHRSCRDFVRKNKHDLYKTGYHQTQDWKEAQKNQDADDDRPVPTGHFGTIEGPMAVRADAENAETGETFASTIPSGEPPPLEGMLIKEQIDILKEEISLLPERERDIINARFFDDKKLAEIAREQGVTRQRINQISQRAFNRLSEKVQDRLDYEVLI